MHTNRSDPRFRPAVWLAAPAMAAAAALIVQASGREQQGAQFRGTVDLVQVDVSVLDRDRRPVRGLTADDFTLVEDGVPQTIANFAFIDTPSREWSETDWPDDIVSNTPSGFVGDGRLIVIFMDDTTIWLPRSRQTAIATARAIVGQLGPNDLASVVFASGQVGADYTNDRARLMNAVSTFSRRITGNLLRRMVRVIEDLAAVPDRRKILFYVGVGVPFDARLLGPTLGVYGQVRGQMAEVMREMQDIFRTAQVANVNVYAVDPGGLHAPSYGNYDPTRYSRDFLEIVSGETGGRAIVNLNEPSTQIPRVFRENSAYYLLGFQSTNPEKDGTFRRLQVKLDRRRTTVRARSGYYALPPPRFPTAGPRERARAAMDTLSTAPGLPMRLSVAPFASAQRGKPALAIVLGLEAARSSRNQPETLDVRTSVFDAYGRPHDAREEQITVNLRGSDSRTVVHQVLSRFDLDPGQYQINVDVHGRERDAGGSVVASVTVPDFAREPISLSGIVVFGADTPRSAPAGALDDLMPEAPTTERVFGPGERAELFVRVYQSGRSRPRAATVDLKILDAAGEVAHQATHTLEPGAFAEQDAADFRADLPLAKLEAGPYVLALEARLDDRQAATREMRFTVR